MGKKETGRTWPDLLYEITEDMGTWPSFIAGTYAMMFVISLFAIICTPTLYAIKLFVSLWD